MASLSIASLSAFAKEAERAKVFVPLLKLFSCPPPWLTAFKMIFFSLINKPEPNRPCILWPAMENISIFSKLNGILPMACTISTWKAIFGNFFKYSPISFIGLIAPISLLTIIRETRIVSSLIAAFNVLTSICPSLLTGKTVTSKPKSCISKTVFKTDGCSVALVIMCLPRLLLAKQ